MNDENFELFSNTLGKESRYKQRVTFSGEHIKDQQVYMNERLKYA